MTTLIPCTSGVYEFDDPPNPLLVVTSDKLYSEINYATLPYSHWKEDLWDIFDFHPQSANSPPLVRQLYQPMANIGLQVCYYPTTCKEKIYYIVDTMNRAMKNTIWFYLQSARYMLPVDVSVTRIYFSIIQSSFELLLLTPVYCATSVLSTVSNNEHLRMLTPDSKYILILSENTTDMIKEEFPKYLAGAITRSTHHDNFSIQNYSIEPFIPSISITDMTGSNSKLFQQLYYYKLRICIKVNGTQCFLESIEYIVLSTTCLQ